MMIMTPEQRAAAQSLLESLAVEEVRAYSTRDFGRERHDGCVSVVVEQEVSLALLQELRDRLPAGMVAFLGTSRWLGDEKHPAGIELAVGPGDSQFDILRHAATADPNGDQDTEALIRRLEQYDQLCGIVLQHAESDTVEFDIVNNPPDLAAFAQDIYQFCPDIVDQGIGSVEALEQAIEITGHVYLWWD